MATSILWLPWVSYGNHRLSFLALLNSRKQQIPKSSGFQQKTCVHWCHSLRVKQLGSLCVHHWQSGTGCLYSPPTSPIWHKVSRVHWWRSRRCWWFRLLLLTFPYLSNSSSQARHGFQGWGRVTFCVPQRGENWLWWSMYDQDYTAHIEAIRMFL